MALAMWFDDLMVTSSSFIVILSMYCSSPTLVFDAKLVVVPPMLFRVLDDGRFVPGVDASTVLCWCIGSLNEPKCTFFVGKVKVLSVV